MDSDMRIIDFEEEEYRRGYCDGWAMAVSYIQQMVAHQNRSLEETWHVCREHRQSLAAWLEEEQAEWLPPALQLQEPAAR